MKNFETIRSRKGLTIGGLGLALLSLTACGSDEGSGKPYDHGEEPSVTAVYYSNGNRILDYKGEDTYFASILQVCDGKDLVEQSEYNDRVGNSIERSVAHPACADGRLTEADFKIQK